MKTKASLKKALSHRSVKVTEVHKHAGGGFHTVDQGPNGLPTTTQHPDLGAVQAHLAQMMGSGAPPAPSDNDGDEAQPQSQSLPVTQQV